MGQIDDSQYVYLKKESKYGGEWGVPFHLVSPDGVTSLCGKVVLGKNGVVEVRRASPVMRAMRCANCAHGSFKSRLER